MVDAKTLLTSEFSCEHDASADDYTVRWMLPDNRMLSLVVSKAGIITCVVSPFSEAAPPVQMHVSDLATLSLAGEDAEGLCEQLKVVSYGADEDDAKILQAARDTIRSLSLRVEAEKRAREKAERERDRSRELYQQLQQSIYDYKMETEAAVVEAEAAETHSTALARALEELSAKVDAFWNDPERPSVHRMRSKSVHELSDAQRRARSLLAPKEDTANG